VNSAHTPNGDTAEEASDSADQPMITQVDAVDLTLAFRLHALDQAQALASGRGLALSSPHGLVEQLAAADVWVAGPLEAPYGWASLEDGLLSGTVRPDQRRTGLGTALLDAVLADGAPHRRLTAAVWEESDGEAFLRARGFAPTPTQPYAVRRLDLPRTRTRRQRLAEDAEPLGASYQFVRVAGDVPEEDPPGMTSYVIHARHRITGAEAGRAELTVADDTPTAAVQGELFVVEEHRGHRLGMLMELELLRWLDADRPGVQALQLRHGLDNTHAIALADRLGSRVAGIVVELAR
jgi:GNAT superfamily N-acetyltransferase